jgi:hypothetical protein
MTNDEKIIELSKGKILLLVIGAAAFVALGIWMYRLDPAWIESQPRFNNPLITHGIGIVSVVFFGLCGILGIKKMFDRRPGLILSAAGLSDNSSGVSAGVIPWDEIEGFGVFKIRSQKLLVIRLTDPEKYIQAGGPGRRALRAMNFKLCGSPFTIASNSLKISFDDLVSLCNVYREKYGKST